MSGQRIVGDHTWVRDGDGYDLVDLNGTVLGSCWREGPGRWRWAVVRTSTVVLSSLKAAQSEVEFAVSSGMAVNRPFLSRGS